jgi:hypothetical protein
MTLSISTPDLVRTDDKRIPVYLLTGYLGSGKTSLLKSWLAQAEFKDAALVINELGEVGLDNQCLRLLHWFARSGRGARRFILGALRKAHATLSQLGH